MSMTASESASEHFSPRKKVKTTHPTAAAKQMIQSDRNESREQNKKLFKHATI